MATEIKRREGGELLREKAGTTRRGKESTRLGVRGPGHHLVFTVLLFVSSWEVP